MSDILLDTSAWIEYLSGTEKGSKIRKLVQSSDRIFTTGLIVAELIGKYVRDGKLIDMPRRALHNLTTLIDFDYALGEETAHVYQQRRRTHPKFGLVDAHIVAAASTSRATIITCDSDFRGLPRVTLIN